MANSMMSRPDNEYQEKILIAGSRMQGNTASRAGPLPRAGMFTESDRLGSGQLRLELRNSEKTH